MAHAQLRRALEPDGRVDTAARRAVEFLNTRADGLCSLVEAFGQDELFRLFDAALDASSPEEPNGALITRKLQLLSNGRPA